MRVLISRLKRRDECDEKAQKIKGQQCDTTGRSFVFCSYSWSHLSFSYKLATEDFAMCSIAQPSYEATAKVRNNASKAFGSDNGAPRQKKQKDPRKVGSGFKSKKRFKRR